MKAGAPGEDPPDKGGNGAVHFDIAKNDKPKRVRSTERSESRVRSGGGGPPSGPGMAWCAPYSRT